MTKKQWRRTRKLIRTITGAAAVVAFVLMLGTVGALDCEMVSDKVGFMRLFGFGLAFAGLVGVWFVFAPYANE